MLPSPSRTFLPSAAVAGAACVAACLWWVAAQPASAGGMAEPAAIAAGLAPVTTRGIVSTSRFRKISLPAIRFEFDSDRLTRAALDQVEKLGQALNLPALRRSSIAVEGHTDSSGSAAYNRALSQRRAAAVKRRLVEMGISRRRVTEVGLGESFPVHGLAPSDERNRRVEVVNLGDRWESLGTGSGETRSPTRRRALLIGIDDYRRVSRLEGPTNDARAMASFLTGQAGFADGDIKLLLDWEATRSNILTAIETWLVMGTAPGDEVFFFFSGHGFQQFDTNGDEDDGKDETLVAVDIDVDGDTIEGMISDDEIAALLTRLPGRRVQVVIDACHSGTVTRGVSGARGDDGWRYVKTPRLPDGTPLRVGRAERPGEEKSMGEGSRSFLSSDAPDLTVWTAARAHQKAFVDREAEDGPGSVFTRRFLWGARDGKADRDRDGTVTVTELHDYVVEESASYCERHRKDCKLGLEPVLHGASDRRGGPAFTGASLPRNATLAKDILVLPPDRPDAGGQGGIRLRIDPGQRLEAGAELDIIVESGRDGHLVLLDIDAAGELTQIFPNEASVGSGVSGRLRAGHPVTLPGERAGFRFHATPPTGRGLLVAVVSEESAQLQNLTSRHKDLSVVSRPQAYLVEIGEALRNGALASRENGDAGWRAGTLEYEIVSPGSAH